MQVQTNPGSNIEGHEDLVREVEAVVQSALGRRFGDQITGVEVHLSDENSHKARDADKRCMMEACRASRSPVTVNHQAAVLVQAIDGAAEKLKKLLDRNLGRLSSQQRTARPAGESSDLDE
jgi:ribosome-associated translation inhibitor RaiA